MTPCLVASDLDGTLLRDDHTLSRRTIAVLERLVADGVRSVVTREGSILPDKMSFVRMGDVG